MEYKVQKVLHVIIDIFHTLFQSSKDSEQIEIPVENPCCIVTWFSIIHTLLRPIPKAMIAGHPIKGVCRPHTMYTSSLVTSLWCF